ncbi:very long chain fatty acid elongase 7-like [Lycorma delicatula]|uniref:very long chain fatty acid elongase 7-like n=1 Tax=Lycorma delicatula TaxID=130591 RepID=UPI003F516D49
MDALTTRLARDFEQMKEEIQPEKTIETWPLMDPYLIVTITVGYLFFTLKLGPDMMKGREAFNLKIPMIIYNAFQVLFNLRICLALFLTPNAIPYLYQNKCLRVSENPATSLSHPLYKAMCEFGWFYLVSKIIDLLDTVFFILRKKQSHVTFLHVYHHASLVLVSWAYLKYVRGEQGVWIGFINTSVHIVMYFYYFLSAFGESMKPYLTWKSYITKFQLAQFAFIIIYLGTLIVNDCTLPKVYSYYMLANGVLFFYLFLDFYQKEYLGTSRKTESPKVFKKDDSYGKPQKKIAVPGSEFWKVFTHGMTFMCFPGLQDELYNNDDDDDDDNGDNNDDKTQ